MHFRLASTLSPALTVTLTGELDMARVPELDSVLARFERSAFSSARLDVRRVDFIDSSGLTTLVRLQQMAARRGGAVWLINPCLQFERVLRITGLHPFFEVVHESE